MAVSRLIKYHEDELKAWTTDPGNKEFMLDDNIEAITAELDDTADLVAFTNIASALGDLAVWYGSVGAKEVLTGIPSGWSEIHRCALYRLWQIKILDVAYERDAKKKKQPRVRLNTAALLLAHLLLLNAQEDVDWLGRLILKSADDGRFGEWSHTPFEPFITWVFGKLQKKEVNLPKGANLGIYSTVVDDWEADIGEHISKLCDYHLENSKQHENGYPEFEWAPYQIFPVEIVALSAVRNRLKLKTTWPTHPLLSTPLADVKLGIPQDPLIERISRGAERL